MQCLATYKYITYILIDKLLLQVKASQENVLWLHDSAVVSCILWILLKRLLTFYLCRWTRSCSNWKPQRGSSCRPQNSALRVVAWSSICDLLVRVEIITISLSGGRFYPVNLELSKQTSFLLHIFTWVFLVWSVAHRPEWCLPTAYIWTTICPSAFIKETLNFVLCAK